MKNNKLLGSSFGFLSVVSVLVLSACGSTPTPTPEGFTYNDVETAANKIEGKKFYIDGSGNETSDSVYISGNPDTNAKIRLLVVPVEFTDALAEDLPGGATFQKNQIKEAFFGDPTTNNKLWQSLASYYDLSSYGNFEIVGDVDDWYNCGLTREELVNIYINDYNSGASGSAPFKILRDYYYLKTGFSEGGVTQGGYEWANKYDANGDGFIDCISMVYTAHSYPKMTPGVDYPNAKKEAYKDTFWAFTHSDFYQKPWFKTSKKFDGLPSNYIPQRYRFTWMSYDFLYDNGYYDNSGVYHDWTDAQIAAGEASIDAHTIIHEHGHALGGYQDYYTYDNTDWGAAGQIDMMDYNVGDHDAYSKMLSQWMTPTVVSGAGTYTLKPLQDEGNCLIIKAKGETWNGSPCDEYLMLEYYTPTGLNLADSQHNFSGSYPKTFSIEGIKIYHIDSRIGLFSYNKTSSSWEFQNYTDKPIIQGSYGKVDIAASNTASRSSNADYKLVHLLESSGKNTFKAGAGATNETLFTQGKSFGVSTFASFKFNSGSSLGYKIYIDSISNGVAKIRVE